MLFACTLHVVLAEENLLCFSLVQFISCSLPLAQLVKLQNQVVGILHDVPLHDHMITPHYMLMLHPLTALKSYLISNKN